MKTSPLLFKDKLTADVALFQKECAAAKKPADLDKAAERFARVAKGVGTDAMFAVFGYAAGKVASPLSKGAWKAAEASAEGAAYLKQAAEVGAGKLGKYADEVASKLLPMPRLLTPEGIEIPITGNPKSANVFESRAKDALSGVEASKVKPVSLPSWDKLNIRVEADGTPHLIYNHKIDGKGYLQSVKDGGAKDPFPAWMSEKQIMKAVKNAYGNAQKVGVQTRSNGEKIFELLGESNGLKIKMYINITTKEVETAFPQYGVK